MSRPLDENSYNETMAALRRTMRASDPRDEQQQRIALRAVQAAEGFAAQDHGVAHLNPDQVAALLGRLATLEAMAQRARSIVEAGSLDDPVGPRDWYLAARDILGEG